ncbi:MAG TPA: AtpZ/AtpI family protein [Desulfosporosinus sp.]|nr:AtpZ/AtpI family protein [Desulfosporosinus sp.]
MAENQKSWQKAVAMGATLSTTVAGLVGGGYFLGHYLDAHWGTKPWLTLSLMLMGLLFSGIYLIMTLKEFEKTDD